MNNKRNRGGRNPKLDPATNRYSVNFSSEEDMKIIELARIIEYKHIFLTHNYHFFTYRTLTLRFFVYICSQIRD